MTLQYSHEWRPPWVSAAADHAGHDGTWSTFHFHRKALGCFAALPGLPHGRIRRLDMATEAAGVEQRMGEPVGGKPSAQLADEPRVGGKPQRQRLIVGERGRDQLR